MYGHVMPPPSPASVVPPSGMPMLHPLISQAPVDIMVSGLTQGTQTSPAMQLPCCKRPTLGSFAILSMHRLKQTPGAPPMESHLAGTKLEPTLMISSGTQSPGPPAVGMQDAKLGASVAGISLEGTQWASPPFWEQQGAPNEEGSIPLLPPQPPPAPVELWLELIMVEVVEPPVLLPVFVPVSTVDAPPAPVVSDDSDEPPQPATVAAATDTLVPSAKRRMRMLLAMA